MLLLTTKYFLKIFLKKNLHARNGGTLDLGEYGEETIDKGLLHNKCPTQVTPPENNFDPHLLNA